MLHPSQPLAIFLALIASAALVLGLATDIGLFGWSLAVIVALYLAIAGIAQRARRRSVSAGRPV